MDHINLPLNLPDKTENMTDLYLNLKDFSFSLWSSREREPKTANYIPIPEVRPEYVQYAVYVRDYH